MAIQQNNGTHLITVPGKVMLAGEWAILEPGNRCLVLAVSRFVTGAISSNQHISISLPDLGLTPCTFRWQTPHLFPLDNYPMPADSRSAYCLAAVTKTLLFLQETGVIIRPFTLTITSAISTVTTRTGRQIKPGLGSSAATVVATITSILTFHNQNTHTPENKNLIFKLATLAHYEVQEYRGSCFDVAAASMGTSIMYQRFDPSWLINKIKTSTSLSDIIKLSWPGLTITTLKIPSNIFFLIGFVGKSAQTTELIKIIENFKNQNPLHYQAWCSKVNNIVCALHEALQNNNTTLILHLIRKNHLLLTNLSQQLDNVLIPQAMQILINIAEQEGAAAKIAGAGGGDCGIAICPSEACLHAVKKKWQDHNILPLTGTIL